MENINNVDFGSVHICCGIVNIKGNISTIHSYNRRKVKKKIYQSMEKQSAQER